jgi:hypothetical protein
MRLGRGVRAPRRFDLEERQQPRLVATLEPARIVMDDVGQKGQPPAHAEQLVDLLLVLGHDHVHARQSEHVHDLVADAGRVDADHQGTQALRGELGDQPLGAVVADHAHHVAALDAQRGEASSKIFDASGVFAPAQALPDAVALLRQRDRVGVRRGMREQEAGQRHDFGLVRRRPAPEHDPACLRAHEALPK